MEKTTRYKTGLVLSGGAVRGFAHAGAMKALNEAEIYPDVVAGSSAGALVGALYADGYSPDDIYKLFVDKSLFKFLEFIVPNKGLVRMTGLYKTLCGSLRAETFEQLNLPLFVTVTDLNHAKCVYISKGELARMIIASCSIPVMFQPVVIDGVTYVDGGVLNNLPMEPIESDCERIIGINVNPVRYQDNFNGMMKVADRTVHMILDRLIEPKKQRFDIYIEPDKLRDYGLLDLAKGKEMFAIGYDAARAELDRLGF
jgi:NTE family protein